MQSNTAPRPGPSIQRDGLNISPWRLKRLYLSNVVLDNQFGTHVNSAACHSLLDMELEDCSWSHCAISSGSLKNLVLRDCFFRELCDITSPTLESLVIVGCSNDASDILIISAPAVVYLFLSVKVHRFHGGVLVNDMPFLDQALIHLLTFNAPGTKVEKDLVKLLSSSTLSNVSRLELSGFKTMVCLLLLYTNIMYHFVHSTNVVESFQVLKEDCATFQEFRNLRNLLLDKCDFSDYFQSLGLFLQNSPDLEKLILQSCTVYCCLHLNFLITM